MRCGSQFVRLRDWGTPWGKETILLIASGVALFALSCGEFFLIVTHYGAAA